MSDTIHNEVSYKFPSNEILENRREFYCLKRGIGESIEMWFKDVQNRVNYCDFSKFGDVFLIDKFICELNHDERDFFRSKKLSSLQRLNDYFVKKRVDSINGFVNLEEYMSLIDDVKSEQDDYHENTETKPIDEFDEEEYSFVRYEPLITIEEEEDIPSPPNESTQIDIFRNGHASIVTEDDINVNLNSVIQWAVVKDHQSTVHEPIDEQKCSKIDVNTPLESFKCLECCANYSDQGKLDHHLRTVHNEIVIHECPNCFIDFHEYTDLLEHFNEHFGVKRIKCDLCAKWFLFQRQLTSHVQEEHHNSHQLICPDCGKISKSNHNFILHYRAEHMLENDTMHCKLCNKIFTKIVSFMSHLRHEHHSIVYMAENRYACKYCDKHFCCLLQLKKHAAVHMKERPYPCELCKKAFTRPYNLKSHKMRIHLNQ